MNDTVWFYLLIYLAIINLITLCIYGFDKAKARKHKWRIPEASLIGLAIVGGSLGALAGMWIFHHKIRKPKFYVGVPVILLIQAGIAAYLYLH